MFLDFKIIFFNSEYKKRPGNNPGESMRPVFFWKVIAENCLNGNKW
jgi:hypothetical protein